MTLRIVPRTGVNTKASAEKSGPVMSRQPAKSTRPESVPESLMVCIVDNDAAIRDSLSFLIESEHIPVASFASAREFLDHWDIKRTGCLIVDIRMPGMSGLELQMELTKLNLQVPMIIITGFADVQLAVQAMKRGAFDFFEKPIHHELLIERLHQALAKEAAARQETAEKLEFQRRYALLSPKERQILNLVVEGKTSMEIAGDLICSSKTVEVHRANIYTKMRCKNLAVIVRMVMLQRVVGPEGEA